MIFKKNKKPILFLSISLLLLILFLGYSILIPTKTLPIYNPSNINPELVDKSLRETSKNHTISNFNLINQNGRVITQEDYNDKIYITDFFFTRCQTICPIMTSNMEILQATFLKDKDVMLLSISVTPEIDTIKALREYATKKSVLDEKWNVTTGDKKQIYALARKSFFAVTDDGDGGLQDFIHTTNFILVDKKKQIRGVYDGTNDEEIDRIIKDIKLLKNN